MYRKLGIIISCCTMALALVALGLGIAGWNIGRRSVICKGIDVVILDKNIHHFIDEDEVVFNVDRDFGGYVNRPVTDINLDKLERILEHEGCIESCEAYFTDDRILHIEVTQCTPVLKFLNEEGEMNYMDSSGDTFVIQREWCEGLPQITGSVKWNDKKWVEGVASMAGALTEYNSWRSLVREFKCQSNGEIVMYLEGHDELFYLGQPTDIRRKFDGIYVYLEKIAPRTDPERKYSAITVKYSGQVVCN